VARHDLGLGPGDQHPAVDEEVQAAERPAPQDVLDGLAVPAAGEHAVHGDHPALRDDGAGVGEVLGALVARRLLDDPPGLLARGLHAGDGQLGLDLPLERGPGQGVGGQLSPHP
jgi:hypothetical protein